MYHYLAIKSILKKTHRQNKAIHKSADVQLSPAASALLPLFLPLPLPWISVSSLSYSFFSSSSCYFPPYFPPRHLQKRVRQGGHHRHPIPSYACNGYYSRRPHPYSAHRRSLRSALPFQQGGSQRRR